MRSRNSSREPLVLSDGENLPHHDEKKRTYYSIFGKLPLERPYFYRRGSEGKTPLDAELSLGSDQYSDLLREMVKELGAYIPYQRSAAILERFLKFGRLSTRVFEKMIAEDAQDVEAYYEQKAPPVAETEAEILVI